MPSDVEVRIYVELPYAVSDYVLLLSTRHVSLPYDVRVGLVATSIILMQVFLYVRCSSLIKICSLEKESTTVRSLSSRF
jgi:hypothetical protein